jgi:hypothetical protein
MIMHGKNKHKTIIKWQAEIALILDSLIISTKITTLKV